MVTAITSPKYNVPPCSGENCGAEKSFKANYYTNNASSYYPKARSGFAAGAVLGGFSAIGNIISMASKQKSFSKGMLGILYTLGLHMGCGAIIDYLRNNKAPNQHYDKSNTGSKVGGWLGAGIGLVSGVVGTIIAKKGMKHLQLQIPSEITTLSAMIVVPMTIAFNALGGWIMGKISDHFAYKNS